MTRALLKSTTKSEYTMCNLTSVNVNIRSTTSQEIAEQTEIFLKNGGEIKYYNTSGKQVSKAEYEVPEIKEISISVSIFADEKKAPAEKTPAEKTPAEKIPAEKYLSSAYTPLQSLDFVMIKDCLDFVDALTVVTNFYDLSVAETDALTTEFEERRAR